jgi:hypothetical protein
VAHVRWPACRHVCPSAFPAEAGNRALRPSDPASPSSRPGIRSGDKPSPAGRGPLQLFRDYLGEQNIEDPRIPRMFADLLDELTGAPDDSAGLVPADHREA